MCSFSLLYCFFYFSLYFLVLQFKFHRTEFSRLVCRDTPPPHSPWGWKGVRLTSSLLVKLNYWVAKRCRSKKCATYIKSLESSDQRSLDGHGGQEKGMGICWICLPISSPRWRGSRSKKGNILPRQANLNWERGKGEGAINMPPNQLENPTKKTEASFLWTCSYSFVLSSTHPILFVRQQSLCSAWGSGKCLCDLQYMVGPKRISFHHQNPRIPLWAPSVSLWTEAKTLGTTILQYEKFSCFERPFLIWHVFKRLIYIY